MADDKKVILSKLVKPIREQINQYLKYLFEFFWSKIGILGLNGSGKSSL
jgi:ABC-type Mn2+/Zn2+ transport system ATPase subunit